MTRSLSVATLVLALIPGLTSAQTTFSGPPTEEDFEYWCKNYGPKGAERRQGCESDMRLRRGVGTCADITWSHSCRVDKMTDRANCTAHGRGSNLFAFSERGKLAFSVTGNTYPGEKSRIRVDSHPAIAFDDDEGTSSAQDNTIERQLRGGTIVRTRYVKWPSGIAVDNEVPICNLPQVLDEMKAESQQR